MTGPFLHLGAVEDLKNTQNSEAENMCEYISIRYKLKGNQHKIFGNFVIFNNIRVFTSLKY